MSSPVLRQPHDTSGRSATPRPSSSLAQLTLAEVSKGLESNGSSLKGQGREAIQALLEALADGLSGSLPKAYHLSAIDPGVGKTLSVATFLRLWKAAGFKPASSVLIGVSRLEEVKAYMEAADLGSDDVAVLTSDEELNTLGVRHEEHRFAPVMFTTQQMIERRTRSRSFAEASEFHFKGAPRSLRIWDESLVPAQGIVVGGDEIAQLPGLLNAKAPALSQVARKLVMKLWDAVDGSLIDIPTELADLPSLASRADGVPEILRALSGLAGRTAIVIHHNNGSVQLVGSSPPLPADFAPVVVLDASGRVRATYDIWEREVGTLIRLPKATNRYDRLRLHLWERPVGQSSFQQPGTLIEVVDAIAEAINNDPTDDWLVVSYKRHPVEEGLRAAVAEHAHHRLHFLTWGMHHGTNEFRHCKKIVLIGHLNYGSAGYAALASASGLPVSEGLRAAEKELKEGEYCHGYLQALTRAAVRQSRNGEAATCTAYVIASPAVGARELLAETFPGCTIETWQPSLKATMDQAGKLIALLEQAAAERREGLTKGELATALGVKGPNLSRLLQHPRVSSYLERKHLVVSRSNISGWPRFEPWAGGGFMVENLEDL